MAISIDRIYKTVLTLTNSDIRGNVKPSDALYAIYDVVNEIIEEYFADLNRALNRENRGMMNGGLENIPDRLREKINHFLVDDTALTYSAGYFALPEDYRYIDTVVYEDADGNISQIEFCKSKREFQNISNYVDTTPSATYPIGYKTEERIKIAPSTIQSDVTISYLRNPLVAKWTYQLIDNVEVYDPDADDHQDIDLHSSEEHNVILRTLNRFGINLKEQDLMGITQNKEAQDFNQENAV